MFGAQLLLKLTHMLTGQTSRTGTASLTSSKNEPRDTKSKDCEQAMEVVKKKGPCNEPEDARMMPKMIAEGYQNPTKTDLEDPPEHSQGPNQAKNTSKSESF